METARRKRSPFSIRETALGLLLVVLMCAVYARMPSAGFISFDDAVYVTDNPSINRGLTIQGIKDAFDFRKGRGPYWHPVTSLSHMTDCALFGLSPGYHHLMNMVFHAVNVLLLFGFLYRYTGALWPSLWVAAVFAVHPLNVETVAWISERKNLLAAMFFLSGLFVWARFLDRRTWGSYGLLIVVFLLGMMSKPVMMTFPFTLFLVTLWPLDGYDGSGKTLRSWVAENRGVILPVLGLILIMLAVFFIGVHLGDVRKNVAPLDYIPLGRRLSVMLTADVIYLVNLVWPVDLAVFHPYPESVPIAHALGAFSVLAAVSILALVRIRTQPFLFVGWFFYVGNLVTASGLMQQGYFPAHADRFTYLPMIGMFIIPAFGLSMLSRSLGRFKPIVPLAAVLSILIFGVLTFRQTAHWKSDITLFRHAVSVNPDDPVSLTNLALALGEAGRFSEAMDISRKALSLEPDYAEALNNLGTLYAKQGDIEGSLGYFNRALAAWPGFDLARANRDRALSLLAEREKRERMLNDALASKPVSLEEAAGAAQALIREKRYAEAETLYLSLIDRHADASVSLYYNLACLNALAGKPDRALYYLEQAFEKGFRAWDHLDRDPDLYALRNHPAFAALIDRYRKGDK
ncbi:tetratricopeptide repeat protein [Desulfatiferula olefinivorans]